MKKQSESGWSLHCHHDTLLEYCHNYQERVDYILQNKPKREQAIRLKVFKLLPKEAVKELPKQLVVAGPKWYKARAELNKAGAEYYKAWAEWGKKAQEAFHKKWCGCAEWNEKEIVFLG